MKRIYRNPYARFDHDDAYAHASRVQSDEETYDMKRVACHACPDGNEWDSNGPTGRECKVCHGKAYLNVQPD